jgi:hypothetical protein
MFDVLNSFALRLAVCTVGSVVLMLAAAAGLGFLINGGFVK